MAENNELAQKQQKQVFKIRRSEYEEEEGCNWVVIKRGFQSVNPSTHIKSLQHHVSQTIVLRSTVLISYETDSRRKSESEKGEVIYIITLNQHAKIGWTRKKQHHDHNRPLQRKEKKKKVQRE